MDHTGNTGYTPQVQSSDEVSYLQHRKVQCPVSLVVSNGFAPGQIFSPTHWNLSHTLCFCLLLRQLPPIMHWKESNILAA